jgi:hypothetical protein
MTTVRVSRDAKKCDHPVREARLDKFVGEDGVHFTVCSREAVRGLDKERLWESPGAGGVGWIFEAWCGGRGVAGGLGGCFRRPRGSVMEPGCSALGNMARTE